ncbi:MAG TPA: translation initiation factor IF-1 [Candidatus Vogelbacteria bacterium]|nr:translation initiation factor IF-1 [Candidatus Vogelbacteria bacterium]
MDNKKISSSDAEGRGVCGLVVEALPNTLFKVKIDGKEILAYLSGKMRLHRIRVMVGDKVEVLLDSYGGKGRIIKRF